MNPFKKPQLKKEKLGQVLLEGRIINPEQLNQALKIQKEQGGLLGEILTRLGFTTEEEIAQALAIQHNFPYLPLANYEIDPEIIKFIPEDIARRFYILPIDKMGDILTVVMANPLDEKVIEEIRNLTGCKIEIFVSTYIEIKDAIERIYIQKNFKRDGEA